MTTKTALVTRRHIEAIGALIAERLIEPDRAKHINRNTGWQYDVAADPGTLAERIRYENVQLSNEEMDLALQFAADIDANPAAFEHDTTWWWHERECAT